MKKLSTIIIVTVSLLVLGISAGYSQKASGQFNKIDQNKDGSVSWEELHNYHPEMDKNSFESADTDKDGNLSHDEWYNFEDKPRKGQGKNCGKGYGQGKKSE